MDERTTRTSAGARRTYAIAKGNAASATKSNTAATIHAIRPVAAKIPVVFEVPLDAGAVSVDNDSSANERSCAE